MDEGADSNESLPDLDARGGAAIEGTIPPADELFRVLADGSRRRMAQYLLAESEMTIDELTDTLVGWQLENADVLNPTDRKRAATSLCHVHLPKLKDAGLVEHDSDAGTVTMVSLAEPVQELLRFAFEYERLEAGRESGNHGE